MASVTVRCAIPGGTEYYMLYDDITIEESDFPEVAELSGDKKIAAMQFLATRQMFIWQMACGYLSKDDYDARISSLRMLIPTSCKGKL